jgi:hypothetical protein
VTFVAKDKDWVAVSIIKTGGTWAYLTGRLKIRGDQGLAESWAKSSLEFRFCGDSEYGAGLSVRLDWPGAEESQSFVRSWRRARNDLKGLETRISYLHASSVLAILDDRIVQLQFLLRREDIVSTKARVVKLAEDPEVQSSLGLIDQCRLGKNRLEAELVAEEPDNAAAGRNRRVLINSPAQSDNGKDLAFLKGNVTIAFPGISKASQLTLSWK